MVDTLISDFLSIRPIVFWVITGMAIAGSLMVRELTGRVSYSLISLPLLWSFSIAGHVFFEFAEMQFGVDRITDAIMGSMFGMSMLVLMVVFLRQTVTLFQK